MGSTEARSAVEWLVLAASDPARARRQWEASPLRVVMLPTGRLWDVLILSSKLGRATLEVLDCLANKPGPVLIDSARQLLGFLVPPGTTVNWLASGVRGLGDGAWIAVPYPGSPTGRMRWLIPPDGTGHLTDPGLLEAALHEAAARLSGS